MALFNRLNYFQDHVELSPIDNYKLVEVLKVFYFWTFFSIGNRRVLIFTIFQQEAQDLYSNYFFSGSGFLNPLVYAITGHRNQYSCILVNILATLKMSLKMLFIFGFQIKRR